MSYQDHYFHGKHIVLVNTWTVINSRGGTEKVFIDMANTLVSMGYRVTAICCDSQQGEPQFELNKKVHFINAYQDNLLSQTFFKNLLSFRLSRKQRHLNRVSYNYSLLSRDLAQYLAVFQDADLIISFQCATTYLLIDRLKISAPIITMFHRHPSAFIENIAYPIYRNAVEKSAYIQVLMPEYEDIVKSAFSGVKTVCIPNIAPQYDSTCDISQKKIITVSRLAKEKRPELLVYAFSLLSKKHPDWKLEYWGEFGDDKLFVSISGLIKSLEISKQFILCGPTDDIPSKLKSASIFAFPSQSEGFSLALAEAMSMGLPTIGCRDCPSVNSIIRDNVNGYLIDPTPSALAEALDKLMNDINLRQLFGKNARNDMKQYSAEVVWESWNNLILDVLKKHN